MDWAFEDEDHLADFFAALPALDAGEQSARYRRVEVDFGGDTAWFEDPFSADAFGVPVGEGPHAVYLLLDGDGDGEFVPEVSAVLVRSGDALPVEAGDLGDGLMTNSGFLVVRGGELDSGVQGVLPAVARALAALKRRPPVEDGGWDRAEDLERGLAEAGIDADTLASDGAEPGDYAEGWLLSADGRSEVVALGCFVDPDGHQLLPCLDSEGNEVGVLLCR
ncbi:hypothetical protein ACFW1A_06355 [Kitasatospora sp. NPDC058965]|uniref:hypothetical protein n=1 Tax=Kitasatospora sp. NPDC058965 TaxID=3346682 RepID=UPI0036831316